MNTETRRKCPCGESFPVRVKVLARLSYTGEDRWVVKPVDRCLTDIVSALQSGGIDMVSSCCGHGGGAGEIMLADGRKLFVILPSKGKEEESD